MAKKSLGKFLAFATLSGAVAAGISYFLRYRSFNKELDKDFHDFEGDGEEDFDGSLPHESCTPERTYVTLGEKKAETETQSDAPADTADFVEEATKKEDTATIEEDCSVQ